MVFEVEIKMKIGVDVDGVLASTYDVLLKYYNDRYNKNFKQKHVTNYHFHNVWGVCKEKAEQILYDFFLTQHQ